MSLTATLPESALATGDARRERCVGAAHATLEEIRAATTAGPRELDGADLSDITRVVAVVASSRGGSSLLYHLLADRDDTLSFAGEHTTLYKLAGVDRHPDGSDAVAADVPIDLPRLSRELFDALGRGLRHHPGELVNYPREVARRLAVQWPLERVGLDHVRTAVAEALGALGPQALALPLFLRVLRLLSSVYPGLDAGYYDLPDQARDGSAIPVPRPPNPLYCVEEPPFVVPHARARPTRRDLATLPLVIKSSVDAYRLPLLRRLFPRAELRVIHLVRNPAASINGLRDGWLDRGFFSYDVSDRATLAIAGYSELSDAARRWWNFDIFPGWQRYTSAPLPAVCAQQWNSAHRAILRDLTADTADASIRVAFEDLLHDDTRAGTLTRIHRFAGLPGPAPIGRMPVVMATVPPAPGRWRTAGPEILATATDPEVLDTAEALGYSKDWRTW